MPRDGRVRLRCTSLPARVYDVMLLLLAVLAVTQHFPGRGLVLTAYLAFRLTGRHLAHSRLAPSVPGRPDRGQRP
ncbi:hypothetical protein [Streptomyces sp. NPDC006333]|uniref:hypothetical protein n=1 Tax=Streptomyces sp. NPDC006333 TaxID=3156753 RepID=UPI0033A34BEA